MIIHAPSNAGNLQINVLSTDRDAAFDDNEIRSHDTNDIIVHCNGHSSCQRNQIHAESVQRTLNITCTNHSECDQQEIHCPDNNDLTLHPQCHIDCRSDASCYDMSIFAMNGTKGTRNGVKIHCDDSDDLICDDSRIYCSDDRVCNLRFHRMQNAWFCHGECGEDVDFDTNSADISSTQSTVSAGFADTNTSSFEHSTPSHEQILDEQTNTNAGAHVDNQKFVVLAYLLLGCVIGGILFCLCIICLICYYVSRRMDKRFAAQQTSANDCSLSSDDSDASYDPASSATDTALSSNVQQMNKRQTFGSMVISDLKDTLNAIAGVEGEKHAMTKCLEISQPRSVRQKSGSDPTTYRPMQQHSNDDDDERFREIERCLNDDLNADHVRVLHHVSTNKRLRGLTYPPLFEHASQTVCSAQDCPQQTELQPRRSSKPLKYSERDVTNSPSNTSLTTDRDETAGEMAVIVLDTVDEAVNKNKQQTHPVLSRADESITITMPCYDYALRFNSAFNSAATMDSVDVECTETSLLTESHGNDDSEQDEEDGLEIAQELDEEEDEEEETATFTHTQTDVYVSSELPPSPPIGAQHDNVYHHRLKSRSRVKKPLSVLRSPRMDDIPEEQDLDMTPEPESRTHQISGTCSLFLHLQTYSNDSKASCHLKQENMVQSPDGYLGEMPMNRMKSK